MTPSYEIYGDAAAPEPGAEQPTAGGGDGPWLVAVEFSNRDQDRPPTVVQIDSMQHATRDDALAAAQQVAVEFDPPDPFVPQGRQVFRDGPDGFLVIIDGAVSTWHMSVRVVQYLGQA